MAISPHLRKNEHPFTAQELNEQSIASPHFRGFPGYPSIVGYQNIGYDKSGWMMNVAVQFDNVESEDGSVVFTKMDGIKHGFNPSKTDHFAARYFTFLRLPS